MMSHAKLASEDNPIVTINSKDQGPKNTSVPSDVPFSKTGNMKKHLSMCEGAKILITKNLDISEKLVNGTIATIKKLDRVGNDIYGNPQGRVYIKCDDDSAGNKYKDARLINELKDCVPIKPEDVDFKYNGKQIYRKQFTFVRKVAQSIICSSCVGGPRPGIRPRHTVV